MSGWVTVDAGENYIAVKSDARFRQFLPHPTESRTVVGLLCADAAKSAAYPFCDKEVWFSTKPDSWQKLNGVFGNVHWGNKDMGHFNKVGGFFGKGTFCTLKPESAPPKGCITQRKESFTLSLILDPCVDAGLVICDSPGHLWR